MKNASPSTRVARNLFHTVNRQHKSEMGKAVTYIDGCRGEFS